MIGQTPSNGGLSVYTVLYRDETIRICDPPLAFTCSADDGDHAEEQCENANPNCDILWVSKTDNIEEAYDDYYNAY